MISIWNLKPIGYRGRRCFAKNIPNFYKYGQIKIDFKNLIENISLIEQNCKNR